jgi:hypothetical protein
MAYINGCFRVYLNGVSRFKYETYESEERYNYLVKYLVQRYKNYEELVVIKYEDINGGNEIVYKNK